MTGTFNPATGPLTTANAVMSQPSINPVTVAGGNLTLQGANGTPDATNPATPVINWTTNTDEVFGADGSFSTGLPLGSESARFFPIKTP